MDIKLEEFSFLIRSKNVQIWSPDSSILMLKQLAEILGRFYGWKSIKKNVFMVYNGFYHGKDEKLVGQSVKK